MNAAKKIDEQPAKRVKIAGISSQIEIRSIAKHIIQKPVDPLSLEMPKPSTINNKVTFKRIVNTATKPPSKMSLALNEHLRRLRQNVPKPADPKDLEIAMLKDKNLAMTTVVSECRAKMSQIQKTLNKLHSETNRDITECMKRLDDLTKPGKVMIIPPLRASADEQDANEFKLPLKTWEELQTFERNLNNLPVYNRAAATIRSKTDGLIFKQLPSAIKFVLKTTISTQLQEHLENRAAYSVHPLKQLKNYVCLLNLVVSNLCPSQAVNETATSKLCQLQTIRNYLTTMLATKRKLLTTEELKQLQEEQSEDVIQKSLMDHQKGNPTREAVKWLQGETLDDDLDEDSEETESEDDCIPVIVPLVPASVYNGLEVDPIKTEVE